jgi:serine/threonine protein kinase
MADSAGDPVVGATLAGYRIERRLGRGGMSVVYLAEDLALGRKVALKVLAPELSDDPSFRDRFRLESRLAAAIDHPNVIPIYEAGEAEGQLYIAMRYVEGTDLRRLIDEEGVLAPTRAVELVARVADGLDAAHERGLVHRDVKPSNVLIANPGEQEHAYLADFGLTKMAKSEEEAREVAQLSGTTDYLAPELITEGGAGNAADTYALGCVLYEALTGGVPFPRGSELETLVAHIDEPAPKPSEARPELPIGLDAVVERGRRTLETATRAPPSWALRRVRPCPRRAAPDGSPPSWLPSPPSWPAPRSRSLCSFAAKVQAQTLPRPISRPAEQFSGLTSKRGSWRRRSGFQVSRSTSQRARERSGWLTTSMTPSIASTRVPTTWLSRDLAEGSPYHRRWRLCLERSGWAPAVKTHMHSSYRWGVRRPQRIRTTCRSWLCDPAVPGRLCAY